MVLPLPESFDKAYDETLKFLYSLERFGILLGLENITALLAQIGNPQTKFPVVHVAGSNGKGSTSSFINSILLEAGYRTALYTSPHLNDFRERVRLDGKLVSKEALYEAVQKVRRIYDPERTTFFEFTTAVAFDCIAEYKPDLAIIEVGLGGRLDATNTVSPVVTIITDISREHEDYLGQGLAAVAGEKAGIVKKGVPLVTGASRAEARKVVLEKAALVGAPVKEFGKDYLGKRATQTSFDYVSRSLTLPNIRLSMPGSHQIKNASTAIAAVGELIAQGYRISEEAIRKGIEKTVFPGRFELIGRKPEVIIDGAHTPEGMRLLKSTFRSQYPGVKPLMLLGMLQDKNYNKLVEIIAPLAREVMCVPPQGVRALESAKLAELINSLGIKAGWAADIETGFRMLKKKAAADDVILCAGSLYMIGPVRRLCGIGDN